MSKFERLRGLVKQNLATAELAARIMKLGGSHIREDSEGAMISAIPSFNRLQVGFGVATTATILFVDLRGSTVRAEAIGPRKTYLTMHALLPALAFAVQEYQGYIVGYRGDGLFAAFGINKHGLNEEAGEGSTVQRACECGQWMIESIRLVVNPALDDVDCSGNLHIGVGIDRGAIVITRIGFWGGDELTAYGNAVNKASKISNLSDNDVCISSEAVLPFPSSKGGKVIIISHPKNSDVRRMQYPQEVLERIAEE